MASTIVAPPTNQWDRIVHSVDSNRRLERVRQQGLYRLFQALSTHDQDLMAGVIKVGVLLDAPVLLLGDLAPPLIGRLVTVEAGADRITAACWCAAENNVEGLSMLYDAGADLVSVGPSGRDPLWHAGRSNADEAWSFLLETAATEGWSIPWAARASDARRRTRVMEMVVARNHDAVAAAAPNVDLASVDEDGRTALHLNLLQDPYTDTDMAIGRLLSEYGAPALAEDRGGVTPAALASTPEQRAVVDRAILAEVTADESHKAQNLRDHLKSQEPLPERAPSDPGFPQIQRPVKFKKPFM